MGAVGALVKDLETNPGDQVFNVPANFTGRKALVYARNWSSVRPRKVIVEPVSFIAGGERTIDEMAKKHKPAPALETLREQAKTKDMNFYDTRIEPAVFILRFDGAQLAIPFHGIDAKTGEECDAPHTLVSEGAWDLYCGNFERMHSKDPRIQAAEAQHVAGKGRRNLVWAEGSNTTKSPAAFVEFIRELIPEPQVVLDTERLYPGMSTEG
jgi:hypothetical protein